MTQSKPDVEDAAVHQSALVPASGARKQSQGYGTKARKISRSFQVWGLATVSLLGLAACSQTPEVFVVGAPVSDFDIESQEPSIESFHDDVQLVDSGVAYEASWDPNFPYYVVWADFKNTSHQVVYEFSIRFGANDANGDQWAALTTSYSNIQILPQQRVTVFEKLWDTRSTGEPVAPVFQSGAADAFLVTPSIVGEVQVSNFQWEHSAGDITGTGRVNNPLEAAIERMKVTVWCTDSLGNIFVVDAGQPDAVPLYPGDQVGFVFDAALSDRHFIQSCQSEVLVLSYDRNIPASP